MARGSTLKLSGHVNGDVDVNQKKLWVYCQKGASAVFEDRLEVLSWKFQGMLNYVQRKCVYSVYQKGICVIYQ
jgi:hypothetical protein